MSILLMLIAMIAIGAVIGRWWTLALPMMLAALLAVIFAMDGSLSDSPVVLVVLLDEICIALGILRRRHAPAGRAGH